MTSPRAMDQAVSQGEELARIPLLHALRGYSGPCLCTGASQQGRAWGRWTDLRTNRIGGARGVAHWHPTGVTQQDVSTTAGAEGKDPKDRRRGAAARDSDYPGPGGADRSQDRAGADFRGRLGTQCLWLPTEAKRSGRDS